MSAEHEPQPEQWNYEATKAKIVAAFAENRFGVVPYNQLPRTISFGDPRAEPRSIMAKLLECRQHSQNTATEYGAVVQYDPGLRKLGIQKDMVSGAETSIAQSFQETMSPSAKIAFLALPEATQQRLVESISGTAKQQRTLDHPMYQVSELGNLLRATTTRFAGMMHSHPNDSTFSPRDIANVLAIPDMKFSAVSFGDTIGVLVTTEETVWLPMEELNTTTERWTGQIDQRLDGFRSADQVRNERNRIQAVAAMVKTVAPKYRLGYYAGSITDSVLQRVY